MVFHCIHTGCSFCGLAKETSLLLRDTFSTSIISHFYTVKIDTYSTLKQRATKNRHLLTKQFKTGAMS